MRILLLILVASVGAPAQWWSVQTSGLATNLRGVSVLYQADKAGLGRHIIWVCGSKGVILRSTNDGANWERRHVAGADELDFRDVEAFDANVAYVMASGQGDQSRIYKTNDGGKSWKLQYSDKRPGFFLDSLACQSSQKCSALSDPVDGKFLVLNTEDGEHWKEMPRDRMPGALTGEGAFAASGSALIRCAGGRIYFGTGGSAIARIFISDDQGKSWKALATPIPGGASSGIFSIACAGSGHLVAVGGDYKQPEGASRVAIYSQDGGETWHLAARQPGGYRSAVASYGAGCFAAVGPNGSDLSGDGGIHWQRAESLSLNALSFAGGEGWAVGPHGTITRHRSTRPGCKGVATAP